MGIKTDIEYPDSTVNPTRGCDGCELWDNKTMTGTCYAGHIHTRWHSAKSKAYPQRFNIPDEVSGRMAIAAKWPSLIGTDRPDKPWLNGMKRFIFIGDMADIFSKGISYQFLWEELICHVDSIAGRNHFWMVLTKQVRNMQGFISWLESRGHRPPAGGFTVPHNLMLMTSVTSNETMIRARKLREIHQAPWKGLSIEPMLGPVQIQPRDLEGISWVVVGGESGRGARPTHPSWVRWIRDVCEETKTPFFFKQWGHYVPGRRGRREDMHGNNARYDYQNKSSSPKFDLDWGAGGIVSIGVGKKEAGRLLDGCEYNGMPVGVQTEIGQ